MWASVEILFTLPASDFEPAPAVESSVIRIESRSWNLESRKVEKYYEFIHKAFKQPRKTILNNIAAQYGKSKGEVEQELNKCNFDPRLRPHNLSIEKIIQLSSVFQE